MSAFTLAIETDNAAFGPTPYDRATEIARLLRVVAKQVENRATAEFDEKLHDLNGNACGSYDLALFDYAAHGETDPDAPTIDPADITELACNYGRGTPSTCYTWDEGNGATWYAVAGSVNVNCTYDPVDDGVNVEDLCDHDTGTAGAPINSAEDMARFCATI
jgi:hypothetical protein